MRLRQFPALQGCTMKYYITLVAALLIAAAPASFCQQWTHKAVSRVTSKQSFSPIGPVALTIQREVQEVNLILSVTDGRGHFVAGLSPSDLTIYDDDKKQTALTFFQSQTDLPLHVALLLDISASITGQFGQEQSTIQEFLRRATRPFDSVSLFAFNQEVQFAAPVLNNWKQISHRVKELKPQGETALYDAVAEASHWLAQDSRPARRIIILISDGEENHSQISLNDTISEVLKDEATIYSVNVLDNPLDTDGKEGTAILQQLSDATGGAYLHANEDGGVDSAFRKIRRELRSQYALAYKPSNLTEQFFHRLRIIAARNLRVRCRTGYYVR
jgi:Ca-activated chloride channel family protein